MHTIEWLIENRVLYSRVWGEQTMEMVKLSNVQLKEMLDQGTAPIHLIMDTREMTAMPRSLSQLQDSMQATKHPSLGWVVTVGTTNPITKYMGMMIAKLFRLRFRRVESFSDTLTFIQTIDPTVDLSLAKPDVVNAANVLNTASVGK
ncbi:MAG TPA: hypothetical protein VHL11_06855 [Phototrophicaceae bacterium]|jgi:hypothetical protein|nr:hypothetical protein [Phototrophicaceae bacterium]